MAKLTKDQICSAVYELIDQSEGYESDELSSMREDALNYYYNRPEAAPSAPGRSALQSSDVADMLEAVLAQIMPAFEMDGIVEFNAESEEDIEQARAETAAVTNMVMQQNNGFYEIQQAVRDALLLRNGLIKVWLDEKVDTDIQTLSQLTMLEYGQLQMQSQDLTNTDNGINVQLLNEDKGFYDVRVTQKTTTRKIKCEAVDPVNFMWEAQYDSIYLQDCNFCAELSYPTRSDLLAMGYKKSTVQNLKPGGQDYEARNQGYDTRKWHGVTPATDLIEFYECYVRIDADGDGIAELLKVCVADKEILDMQEMQYVPYAAGTAFLQPHRFNGLGLFDKLRYVQDAKTAVMRQLIDNQNHANNSRIGVVDGQVNMDDVTNSRPGGIVRIRSIDSVIPFPFNDIGASAQNTLAYLDKVRSERGGASLDLQSAELQIAGETAHGVERQMSAKEQLAAMMTRTLAETLIRSTWQLVHFAMRLYIPEEVTFRTSDKFIRVKPAEWPERKSLTVKGGLSMAERMRKKQALETVVMRQDILQQQGKYVSEDDIYNAQVDWSHVQGINNPERYFTDPKSQEAQQYAQQQAQAAQAQQAKEAQLLALQQEIEDRKANNEDAKVFEDARQFDAELQFKYWEAGQKQEVEEARIATDIALKMVEPDEQEDESG